MDIDPPPFPKSSANPDQLYGYLVDLRDWVLDHTPWANMQASRLNGPEEPYIPEMVNLPPSGADFYRRLAVPDMFISWNATRKLREKYDEIVRHYEDEEDWNSDPCIYHRLQLIRSAALVISLAFLDREKREAKEAELFKRQRQQLLKQMKSSFKEMRDFFADLNEGEDDDDDDDDHGIDYDALFHPDES